MGLMKGTVSRPKIMKIMKSHKNKLPLSKKTTQHLHQIPLRLNRIDRWCFEVYGPRSNHVSYQAKQKVMEMRKASRGKIFLDYVMFLKRLTQEANVEAKQNHDSTIEAEHIKKVAKKVFEGCKG
ncbi:hypothetical protein CAPTEDRAFT_226632 [Capitella teleta]|uniref:Centromere protein W n=1 Tax=Capitella teleta TaxID=283909 RepID=R7TPB3_CAPTE|nr:hypothetical protein CAPTEDRAFT_226632 [Capitella teleta]|eukprot:ELT95509.1 hypothetical protein CAPTEDRAFT_226632 [Capitella teleta]